MSPRFLISEMQFYAPEPRTVWEKEALPDLMKLLEKREIRRLYSDRWTANSVYRTSKGAIITELEPEVFGVVNPPGPRWTLLEPKTGLLIHARDVEQGRFCLAARNVVMRETPVASTSSFSDGTRSRGCNSPLEMRRMISSLTCR